MKNVITSRAPVLPEEKITKVRSIVGKDGIERELIHVEEVKSALPTPGGVRTTRTFNLYGTTRKLSAMLRHGYGLDLAIVTDGKTYRYV